MNAHRMLRVASAAFLLLLTARTAVLAQTPAPPDPYLYGSHMMWGGGWYGMVMGPLLMILMVAATITIVVALVRWLGSPGHGAPPQARTPLDILKGRFARGEIDKAEFEERRRVLGD